MSNVRFLGWPLQKLVFSKPFGFGLGALLVTSTLAWRRLTETPRILVATVDLI